MLKDIAELVEAGVITEETATEIRSYYARKNPQSHNRMLIAFGILGALLVGLGIILIIAHNWDELARWFKTVLAFLPLLIGQFVCGYALFKKSESVAWRESSSAFLFMAVGAAISLISQIYNMSGTLAGFMLTWMLLCAPLIYVMRSSIASLLYIAGITYYACETGYWSRYEGGNPHLFWLLLLVVLPHYYLLIKAKTESNALNFHHRMIPLAIVIVLGTAARSSEELMAIAYMSLFGALYLAGSVITKTHQNFYKKLGSTGTLVVLITFSFKWFWQELYKHKVDVLSAEFAVAIVTTLIAATMFFVKHRKQPDEQFDPMELTFVWFILIFVAGIFSYIAATIAVNILVLILGIYSIVRGAKETSLSVMNFGLLVITALIVCRFFDTNLSFVARGILFVLLGIGFFLSNYFMLQKRRNNG